ncbi:type II toxin-antitoxin system Phd/YefM family antitoxin [Deferribacter abyssi]|uniref:type II toxin-antitoxin system Phd/YefM family antitoxin n=1 Tax=Deferribacter abyssi TaxID=213806 RepID=UPI003C1901D6
MLVDTDKIISITELQKNLPKMIRNLKSPIFVSKRNKISAVLLSLDEYEKLNEFMSLLEHLEIAENIKERQKNYNPEKNISWDKIKKEYGL